MKKFFVFILSVLFSTAGFASSYKIEQIEKLRLRKDFKPLLRQQKARDILEMNKDDDKEEMFEIKNKKYINYEKQEEDSGEDENDEQEDKELLKKQKENIKILTANYKNILKLSSSCCVANIAEKIKMHNMNKQAKKENIIDLLTVDANTYYVQNTCLLLSDIAINNIVKNKNLNNIFKSTRKDCICNNQEFLNDNIKNFQKLYAADKNFYKTKFIYESKDDQGRIIEQDMNETVLNILDTIASCPN